MFVVLTPVLFMIGQQDPVKISALDVLGVLVWIIGFTIESLADYQLDAFKSRSYNRGGILETGLWKFSRHPNYFGEIVMWWGIYCMALSLSGGLYAIVGPLAITFLILKVSGIPLLEEHYRDNPLFHQTANSVGNTPLRVAKVITATKKGEVHAFALFRSLLQPGHVLLLL